MLKDEKKILYLALRNYDEYKALIQSREERLQEISEEINKAFFRTGSVIQKSNNPSPLPVDTRINELISLESELGKELQAYKYQVELVEQFRASLIGTDKEIIEEWFFVRKRQGWKDFCKYYHYSKNGMDKHIGRILADFLAKRSKNS